MSEVDLGLGALAALAVVSVACGLAMLWVLRTCSDQASLARTKSLIVAHLLEFRLFGDEPALVLRAQRDVALESLRMIRLLLVPAAIMAVPMFFLIVQLDAVFGKSPLAPGEAGVVTVHWTGAGEPPRLEASSGIAVESPPVRAPAHQVSWRFRATQAGTGLLLFEQGGQSWTKSVTAGRGISYISERRVRLGPGYPLYSTELPLPRGDIEWIEIRYGSAVVVGLHWLVWFLLFSGAAFFAGSGFWF